MKKALTKDELKRLYQYPTLEGTPEDRAKDYWFFSYLCNGINMNDMFKLKYKNIDFQNETITFIRTKTKKTNRQNLKPILAIITPQIKTIIKKWGNPHVNPNVYVFPILSDGLSPNDELKRINQGIKTTNKYMKRIGKELDFPLILTSYVARHTYSTILKNSGYAVSFISESLGHSSLKTTQNYLDSFDTESKKEAANKLLDF
ncbi:tyrosine-type recombinase/integrase [Marinilabiliaceae bacterium AAT]|uniref:Tyrosine-type recombinase/integrase n=1 Tax=Plebeiibacterium sediminum TaxID=2992112 RepID=A0AAE3M9L8_9BACT|nr:tyrosine-type recombinase/integrase [Plebeiobacterium sediminum]MCW3789365.1 tyrosine-type recombinase/integrase [Plebeiobacterium sediminum]